MKTVKENNLIGFKRRIKEAIIEETVRRSIQAEKSLFNEFDEYDLESKKYTKL